MPCEYICMATKKHAMNIETMTSTVKWKRAESRDDEAGAPEGMPQLFKKEDKPA